MAATREHPRRSATWLVAGTVFLATPACVTTVVEFDEPEHVQLEMASVVIPFGGGNARAGAQNQYYSSILTQMREALIERDLGRLRALAGGHDRDDAPAWARDRIARFRVAAKGLAFELRAAEFAELRLQKEQRAIGAPLEAVLVVPRPAERGVVLGGRNAERPISFLVTAMVRDTDVFGDVSQRETSMILQLERDVEFDAGDRVSEPFLIDLGTVSAVVRELVLRADLLPGMISVDGESAPVHRVVLVEHAETIYPRGVEPIRAQPLRTLRNALAVGDSAHFPHLLLAARFMPAGDRDAATALLVDRVRLGQPSQARSAMACLRTLTGLNIGDEDREGWLRWWQSR